MEKFKRSKGILVFNPTAPPKTGVIYVYARWSWSTFYDKFVLQKFEEIPEVPLYVVDADSESIKLVAQWTGGVSHGNGELYFFIDGRMVHKIDSIRIAGVLENIVSDCRRILGPNLD